MKKKASNRGPRGPRNWVQSQKRFIERAIKKFNAVAARTDGTVANVAKTVVERLDALAKSVAALPQDYRPQGRKNILKVGDEVFLQPSLREKYSKLLSPKSVVEAMKVEQIDGRRVRVRLAGGEITLFAVNALARQK